MQAPHSYLVISTRPPYGTPHARAAIDLALTAAAFEQEVTLVFLGEGVLQLLDAQDCEASGVKNVGKMIPALRLFDVRRVCFHRPSATGRNLDESRFTGAPEVIDDDELGNLVKSARQVMVF